MRNQSNVCRVLVVDGQGGGIGSQLVKLLRACLPEHCELIGVVMANGILGEVSPQMATAISGADAKKILIPSSTCGIYVAGTEDCRMEEYLRRAVQVVMQVIAE